MSQSYDRIVQLLHRQQVDPTPEGLDSLAVAFRPLIRWLVGRDGGLPADDREDACQEILIKVIRKIDRIRTPDRYHAWLRTIVTNYLADYHRQLSVRCQDLPLDEENPALGVGAVQDESYTLGLVDAFRMLTKAQQKVLLLHVLRYSTTEIGQQLSLPPSTVRKRIQRARFRLRAELEKGDVNIGGQHGPPRNRKSAERNANAQL